MPTLITGENGAVVEQTTKIAVAGWSKAGRKARVGRKAHRARNARGRKA
jgi:hypothetical protein